MDLYRVCKSNEYTVTRKKHISKRNLMGKKVGIQSATAVAFFHSSGLSNGLLSEQRGHETGTNIFLHLLLQGE